ncbi:hypothetical protein CHLRE_16g687700v5 [Chlamydomonas reinhardtii]|uniref:Uncharacterized protein n=1 Tax=Chlamydomonas reinhardtii TaxID=3055 RepID=A0A2K3CUL4_CHLRE|nr:uncharacterized protein CHLRE_16g687700v5 [Chlamydomonas reinhardtii]PNW71973.1 hypothetical protein CHLRE_16g687700v5 [Chlamydomonas reinhardtii]
MEEYGGAPGACRVEPIQGGPQGGSGRAGERVEDVFSCVLPYLAPADRVSLRGVSAPLRNMANRSTTRVSLCGTAVLHALGSSQLLKRFPRLSSLDFTLGSPAEGKQATLALLTQPDQQSSQLARLTWNENRIAAQQLHQQQNSTGGYGQQSESRYQHYNASGSRSSPATFDFTESILAAVCSGAPVKSVSVDKTALLETEAAAIARMTALEELRLATNSSAQPLRRPLVQLMLGNMRNLRVLKLSYIRDTTADMVLSLPRLPNLSKLILHYAYWGESGAGERVMSALAKHQRKLTELRLYECCVNDDMLRIITGITTLRRLAIQDEDAPEESCPTTKGLARLTQLQRLEQLELFGEELQLDGELLSRLAALPALRYLAMAGLDSLQADDLDMGGAGEGVEELDGEVEDMDLSSTMGDEDETEESSAQSYGDEVTSRPQHSSARSHGAAAFSVRIQQAPQQQLARLPVATAGPGGASHPAPNAGPQRFPQQSPRQPQPAPRPAASPAGGAAALPAAPAPLQVLRRLDTLRLYGPSSLSSSPPPLALLLPQPGLRRLKLSACASHANLRALGAQTGLQKLIVSHTAVPQLYPMLQALPLAPQQLAPPQQAQLLLQQQPLPAGASILGFHSEVILSLTSLVILRIKDLPGFMDGNLADLASALARLPCLAELKLRSLGMVSDMGLHTLIAVSQLRRLKLYALGDGVTEHGAAHLAASLPRLEELKVKDCRRVGPSLRQTIELFRASAVASGAGGASSSVGSLSCSSGQAPSGSAGGSAGGVGRAQVVVPVLGPMPVVRYGPQECEGGRFPSAA